MKLNRANKLFIVALVYLQIIFLGFSRKTDKQEARGVFSWKSLQVLEGRHELFETMEKLDVNTVYQEFSTNLKKQDVDMFLSEASEREIDVYFLAGSSKWALDPSGESMIKRIDRVLDINQELEEKEKIKSIMFDVEPYLLKEWKDGDSEGVMNKFHIRTLNV